MGNDAFYERMAGTATRILKKYGQGTITLVRGTPGTADPDRPWIPGVPTEQTYTLDGAVRTVDRRFVDGTLVIATDEQATISVLARDALGVSARIVPVMEDRILVDGRPRTVKKIMPIPAAGPAVAYAIVMAA